LFDLFTAAGISPVGVMDTGGAVETHDGPDLRRTQIDARQPLAALLHEGG